jgi:5'-nucleotidase/UDP-sugar diphosphatase
MNPVSAFLHARRPIRAAVLAAALLFGAGLHTGAFAQNAKITFLHFNDVYEIVPIKGQGGFAPLMTLLKQERAAHPNTVTTVGGDFLSPSLLSGLTEGAQMIDLFNAVGVDLVGFGNHEFDFGPDVPKQRIAESKFVWLGTNILGVDGQVYPGSVATVTRTAGDVKIGFFGLLTPDTAQLSDSGPSIRFADPVATAKAAVEKLKAEGAHVIVALTHLDLADDRALAQQVKGINLILGGHDHEPISIYENGALILKAGSDAHYLAAIDLDVRTDTQGSKGPVTTALPTWRMLTTAGVAPDPEIGALVQKYQSQLDTELGAVVGRTAVELDSRRDTVRVTEATIGNLIADAMRDSTGADVAITNGGGIRGDTTYAAGSDLTRKNILAELPFGNVTVLLEMTGADLRTAVEHGFSKIEDKAGRFPQVSGMTVTYDPKKPSGQRVTDIQVSGKPLDPKALYKVATNDYMAGGGDGYAMLTGSRRIIDASGAVLMATTVMNYIAAKGPVSPKIEGRITAVR